LEKSKTNSTKSPESRKEQELSVAIAEARHASLLATVIAERIEDAGGKDSEEWRIAATNAVADQRQLAIKEARLKVHQSLATLAKAQNKVDEAARSSATTNTTSAVTPTPEKAKSKSPDAVENAAKELEAATKKVAEAEKSLAEASKVAQAVAGTDYKPRPAESFPSASTGRRLAFARWVTDVNNPLTARVAMNHVWLRHFGRGLVPTPADFGRNGRPPSHPQLLDWLAAEFVAHGWSMKAMHRLIVTSSAYRMASTSDESSARIDPDNVYLWRMNSRRLEAEAVRDNLLHVTGNLDATFGGPDIDHGQGLTSKRRSIYLRLAAEKEVEFLRIFDGPSVTECYERRPSVMPQQALALANSEMAFAEARLLAKTLSVEAESDEEFIRAAFTRVLARLPKREEARLCREFLVAASPITAISNVPAASAGPDRARENLILVLFNHNDFVTLR